MMLRPCPDCNNLCSELAGTCPQCGRPLAIPVQLIEQTGKKYKKGMLIGAGVMCVSMLSCSMSMTSNPSLAALCFPAFLVGLAIYVTAGVKSWWDHG